MLFADHGTCDPSNSEGIDVFVNVLLLEDAVYRDMSNYDVDPLTFASYQQELLDWRRATMATMESFSGDVVAQVRAVTEAIREACIRFDEKHSCEGIVAYGARLFVWLWLVTHYPDRVCPPPSPQAVQWRERFEKQEQEFRRGVPADLLESHDAAFSSLLEKPCDSNMDVFRASTEKIEEYKRKHAVPITKPQIVITKKPLHTLTEKALAILEVQNDPTKVCVRGNELARLRRDPKGRLYIESHSEASLKGEMDRAADWLKAQKYDLVPTSPPTEVVRDFLALGNWRFTRIEGITDSPIVRPDGTILQTHGPDISTNLFCDQGRMYVPPVPTSPTRDDINRAKELIVIQLFGDFPFEDQSSRANCVAALFTPTVRPAISGCIPLCCVDKPRAGTGASLLTETISRIVLGRAMDPTAVPGDDVEMNKIITSCLLQGASLIFFDNLHRPLQFPSLEAALTSSSWRGRRLGHSQMLELVMRAIFYVTGNNLDLAGDLPRRCYWIRLDAKVSQARKRKGFKHPNLLRWVDESRPQLLHAVLTLARAWFAAGRPPAVVPQLGGFEEWATTVGGILAHAGIEGFLGNADQFYRRVDEGAVEMELFLSTWHQIFQEHPITSGEVVEQYIHKNALCEVMPTVITEVIAGRDVHPQNAANRIGKVLRKHTGIIFGDYRLERKGLIDSQGRQVASEEAHMSLNRFQRIVHGEVQEWSGRCNTTNPVCKTLIPQEDSFYPGSMGSYFHPYVRRKRKIHSFIESVHRIIRGGPSRSPRTPRCIQKATYLHQLVARCFTSNLSLPLR